MRTIADHFFYLKTERNATLRTNFTDKKKGPPILFSKDCRDSELVFDTRLNLVEGLLFCPYSDTFYCRFGSWQFNTQKKCIRLIKYIDHKQQIIHCPRMITLPGTLWTPLYRNLISYAGLSVYRDQASVKGLYVVTRVNGSELGISPIIQEVPRACSSSSSATEDFAETPVLPEEAQNIWKAMQERYKKENE